MGVEDSPRKAGGSPKAALVQRWLTLAHFKRFLTSFDPACHPRHAADALGAFVANPLASPQEIRCASVVCEVLSAWLHIVHRYAVFLVENGLSSETGETAPCV